MDIAPLGFSVDTSGLTAGKQAAEDFAKSTNTAADSVERLARVTAAQAQVAKAQAQVLATAKASRAAVMEVNDGTPEQAARRKKALDDIAAATDKLTTAKKGLTAAEKDVSHAGGKAADVLELTKDQIVKLHPILAGATMEVSRLATAMGIGGGGGGGGGPGLAGASMAARAQMMLMRPATALLASTTGTLTLGVGTLVAAYGALAVAVSDNQDRWAKYRAQLNAALGDNTAGAASLRGVSDMANELGIGMDTAFESFSRFSEVRDEVGATNEQLLVMTETVLKLGMAAGRSQGEQLSAITQLTQAMAMGNLSGENLRSLMTSMPTLTKELAASLGVSTTELRRMGAEGELTGEKVAKALLSMNAKADAAAKQMPKTVESAKERIKAQWDELMASIGEKSGASWAVTTAIGLAAKPVEALNKALRDDAPVVRTTNLKRLTEEQDRANASADKLLLTLNKEFNKDLVRGQELTKQRAEIQAKIAAEKAILAKAPDLLAARRWELEQQAPQMRSLNRLTGSTSPEVAAAAKAAIEARTKAYRDQQAAAAGAASNIAELEYNAAAVERALVQLKMNDPFEQMVTDLADLNKAIATGAVGGMIQLRIEAEKTARATDQTADAALRAAVALKTRNFEVEISGKEKAIEIQRGLAASIAGGGDKLSAEAAAEAAQRAFDDFGNAIDNNGEIVQRYTNALYDMKKALQAVGDATELVRLKSQLEELNSTINVVTSGGGSYAERLAKHQAQIVQFQRERAGGTGSPVTGGALPVMGGGGSVATVSALLKSAFGGTITSTTGGKHVAGSDHYKGQAVDFVPRGGMRGATKAQIRELMAASNISIKQLLGPGDKDHDDHFHVAFNRGGGRPGTAPRVGAGVAGLGGDVVSLRNQVFATEEQLAAQRNITGLDKSRTDNISRIDALERGGNEELRKLELQLKIVDAQDQYADAFRPIIAAEITSADLAERRLKAQQQITDLTQSNADNARRNEAATTGNPARVRALELELKIAEIKRTQPEDKQAGLIAEATTSAEIERGAALARMTGDLTNQQRMAGEQYKLIGLIGDEERIQNRLIMERNALYMQGIDANSEIGLQYLTQAETLERQLIALDKAREKWDAIRSTGRDTAEAIGSAFGEFFGTMTRTGELKWKTMMGAIEEAFYSALDRMVQQFVISPIVNLLTKAFTAGLTGLFGGGGVDLMSNTGPITETANGRVFGNEGVVPFAGGGLFNVPTPFLFGGGGGRSRRGLAGEGPGSYEAIMPLRRGADGKLGVAGSGGGGTNTTINVFDQRAAGTSEAVEIQERESGDGGRLIDVTIRDTVKSHFRRGTFDSDNRAIYGIGRQTQRR